MNIQSFLEEAVRIQSHSSVEEIKNLLVNSIKEARRDKSGCIVAKKGDGKPHVIFNTHMDTVPPPISFKSEKETIKGRGACDAKASLTAMTYAFLKSNPNHKTTFIVSPDEETKSEGLYRYLENEKLNAEMAVIGEPTNLDICNSARGRFEIIVNLKGKAGHAATGGINAIDCVSEAIKEIKSIDGTTITNLEAGEARNRIPENAEMLIDARGEKKSEDFLREIKKSLIEVECESDVNLVERYSDFLEAFETPREEYIIELLSESIKDFDINPVVRQFKAATEASYFSSYMPTVVFGPGDIEVAHSKDEKIKIKEVEKAGEILLNFLNRSKNKI